MANEIRNNLITFYASCFKNKMIEISNKIFTIKSIFHKIETENIKYITFEADKVTLKFIKKTRDD